MTDTQSLKLAAATRALNYVHDGMTLGLGSGSTAEIFVGLLAASIRERKKLRCVATSERTAALARKAGFELADLDDLAPLDLTIDGADESDPHLNLIKGGGGMLLREKIVAATSKKMVVIADESKLVPQLGKYPLPIEVVEFGHKSTAMRLAELFGQLGYGDVPLRLRARDGIIFRTDSANVIYDCAFGAIVDPAKLSAAISNIAGVAGHGLFIGLASTLLIAGPREVKVIERP